MESRVQCAEFSENRDYLALGSFDGIIEIWDSVLMNLKSDLNYQRDEQFMFHESNVHSLSFNEDSELLASGDKAGVIKIWKVKTGKCLKQIIGAFNESVNCIKFGIDQSQLYVGTNKNTIKIYGLRSGKVIMEYRSKQEGGVNDFICQVDSLMSGGSDGYLRLWDNHTGEQKKIHQLPRIDNQGGVELEIYNIFQLENNYLVCDRSERLSIIDKEFFQIIQEFSNDSNQDFISCTISANKKFVYGVTNQGYIYCFDISNGKLVSFMNVTNQQIIGVKHHPQKNILVIFTLNGDFMFFRASL